MFKSTIQGIPCQIKIIMHRPIIPASFHDPEEGGEVEYEVYDRKGYKADWLERKITEEDDLRIIKEVRLQMQPMR